MKGGVRLDEDLPGVSLERLLDGFRMKSLLRGMARAMVRLSLLLVLM